MGNQNSTNSKPHSASTTPVTSSPANHESPRAPPPSSRRDPKNLNLIHSQRTTAAPPEPSQAQARGAVTHRTGTGASQSSNPVSQFRDARGSRNHHNHSTHSTHSTPSTHTNSSSNSAHMGAQQSKSEPKPVEQASQPVAVPVPISHTDSSSSRSHQSHSLEPSGPPATQDMSYHLTRPPRLPLPIEEEVHTPGSPIVANSDSEVEASVPTLDLETTEHEVLPRKSSALSSTTVEEDDDAEELAVDKTKATVPTIFEWRRGGDKVYVTGSIFQWNKKHRLHPVEGEPGLLRATIHVRPGTHHVRFLVDGAMQCSPDLPTTVDFGNNLVNYVEVSADDLPPDTAASATGTGAPVISAEETTPSDSKTEVESAKDEVAKPTVKAKPVLPAARYTSQIPQFLEDLDKAEDTQAYQYAAAAIEKLPTPPSLPGFLGKPILNANPPMKDDNSVLIMPNHTVLNHLTTSSIKNNVLAVAATTRYKRKYVTTIMYKPTGIGED